MSHLYNLLLDFSGNLNQWIDNMCADGHVASKYTQLVEEDTRKSRPWIGERYKIILLYATKSFPASPVVSRTNQEKEI